jgi:hypothetical protein
MNFEKLVTSIQTTSATLQQNAVKAVNIHLTLRNWLVGLYIVEYEQNGEDWAKYGQQLLSSLANEIKIKGLGETNLKLCRQFYVVYPDILETLTPEYHNLIPASIRQTLSDKFGVKGTTEYLKQLLRSCYFSHMVEWISLKASTFWNCQIKKTS